MTLNGSTHEHLVALLVETGHAHHEAYIENDGADPEWPMWYAGYLQPRLEGFFEEMPTQSRLIQLLVLADDSHASEAPQTDWADHYAGVLLEQLG